MMRSVIFAVLWLAATCAWANPSSLLQHRSVTYSKNVSSCPGYALGSLDQNNYGLTAKLTLAGGNCNAFGVDIKDLTIEVTYQSQTTLHVKIYDTANQQFTIPESVVERPAAPTESFTGSSDLVFNFDPSPFAFWITRRSEPDSAPLFDTRIKSLPPTPIPPFNTSDPSTAFDGFQLVFEDQYLQLTSALPYGTNIYGLGEVIASSGFRRDIGTDGGVGTIQTHWNVDAPDYIDESMYGTHPIFLEHRYNKTTGKSSSSGALLLSSAGSDVFLQTPVDSEVSLIQYRMLGGILDFYFFSGPSDLDVISQYGATVGYPMWQPAWGFGFHLCRWGYVNISEDLANIAAMRAANIPLEVQWNDIDLYHAYRDFTTDPVRFPIDEVRQMIDTLTANHQHYMSIIEPAIAITVNATDVYYPYSTGAALDTYIKNPDGSPYFSQVWPGYTVFPDWFAPNTQDWWTEALKNWTETGVNLSGGWLDMNEPRAFCSYSCGTGANLSALQPYSVAGTVVHGYPECYNETIWGPSGNMTINGQSTGDCGPGSITGYEIVDGVESLTYRMYTPSSEKRSAELDDDFDSYFDLETRGVGAGNDSNADLNDPPYSIHINNGYLSALSVATNTTHYGGYVELDVHNLFGMMEEKATHLAFKSVHKGKRPFLISRSTFPSAGKWTGHWLGDNYSKWAYLHQNIQGVLQFQLYQIPMVGADACGFNGNTGEELCNRWMQLAAFVPFYRNHNTYAALSQEPYRWDSVANATRIAIAARYSLLPYWYTLFANASTYGLPPVRALFYEFPDEPELFANDKQWLIGRDILVTPVLLPGVTTVNGIFPGRGSVIWRDWWTHEVVPVVPGETTNLDAPLSHINVHIRDNSALLLHQEPAYTIYETRQGPYSLLVSLNAEGMAAGNAYVDDGESDPPGPYRILDFYESEGTLTISSSGQYTIDQKLETITILGAQNPTEVTVNSATIQGYTYDATKEELVISGLSIDLNAAVTYVKVK